MEKIVLIVDDAATIRSLVKFAIGKSGYKVIEATDGLEGYAAAEKEKPHLIISDLNMPNMNGLEMVKKIKEHNTLKDIPIFMLTTEASTERSNEGKVAGVTAWIVKPFTPEKLLAAIQKVLGP